MTVAPALLLLADSRLPAGAHAHSGGIEAAIAAGSVDSLAGLETFLRGRLVTAGLTSAALAAAACEHASAVSAGAAPDWPGLAAEAAARTPSPAQRRAACAQGRALLRAARAAWPHPVLDGFADGQAQDCAYHPLVLGACVHAAGGSAVDATVIATTSAITGPASAAVRLLGFDPLAVHALLARLAGEAAEVAAQAAAAVGAPSGAGGQAQPAEDRWAALPAPSSPSLDLLAERHAEEEVTLFES